jgi:hypothetical protein
MSEYFVIVVVVVVVVVDEDMDIVICVHLNLSAERHSSYTVGFVHFSRDRAGQQHAFHIFGTTFFIRLEDGVRFSFWS